MPWPSTWTRSWTSPHYKKPTLGQPSSSGVETLNSCCKPGWVVGTGIPDLPSPSACLGEGWGVGKRCLKTGNTTGHIDSRGSPSLPAWPLCPPFSPLSSCHPFSAAFSLVFSPSHYPEIRRLFPRAQMQTVPNASHWVHSERPQDFTAAVRSFLA